LNKKFKILFEINNNHKWVDSLQRITKEYNEKDMHRSIGIQPIKVTAKNEDLIRRKLFPKRGKFSWSYYPKFEIGDKVRISCKKSVFQDKYSKNWTREIFFRTIPTTYTIKDDQGETIVGKFYDKELQKTFSQ